MSGSDSSLKSRNPSHDSGAPDKLVQSREGRNTSNPIILGFFGIVLIGSAAIGGWRLYTYPTAQAHPRTSFQPMQVPEVAGSATILPMAIDGPVNPSAPAKSPTISPPPPIRETAPKRTTSEAKKSAPTAIVKETAGAIVSQKTLPIDPGPPQQPESPAPTRLPQPPQEKDEERKPPPVMEQPAPLVAVSLSDGLPVRMLLVEDVPADAPEGMIVQFVVAGNVQIDDKTIIAKGAVIAASVAGHKKKILGIGSGKVTYQLGTVHAIDRVQLKLRATSRRSGDGTSTSQFEPPKGPQKKGFAAVQGTEYVGYVDTAQTVSIRK